MAIIFPNTPVVDQFYSAANKTWQWTGSAWKIVPYSHTTLEGASANWNAAYSIVNAKEADWDSAYSIVDTNNTTWSSTTSNVSANSASWTNTYNIVNNSQSDWDSVYTVVASNSAANWLNTPDTEFLLIPIGDEATDVNIGINVFSFRMPYNFDLTRVKASVSTAPVGGNIEINLKSNGSTIFSTNCFIDDGTETSLAAALQSVLNINSTLSNDDKITVDIEGTGVSIKGSGLKLTLIGTQY